MKKTDLLKRIGTGGVKVALAAQRITIALGHLADDHDITTQTIRELVDRQTGLHAASSHLSDADLQRVASRRRTAHQAREGAGEGEAEEVTTELYWRGPRPRRGVSGVLRRSRVCRKSGFRLEITEPNGVLLEMSKMAFQFFQGCALPAELSHLTLVFPVFLVFVPTILTTALTTANLFGLSVTTGRSCQKPLAPWQRPKGRAML